MQALLDACACDESEFVGRLLVNLELKRERHPPIDIKCADRKEYYDAFDGCHFGRDPQAMGHFFARCMIERLTRYLEILG